jgi:hypothetical protein
MKTSKRSNHMSDLTAKLKACAPEVQLYVTALKAENLKFQRQIAKLQAENESLRNRIKILKEEGGEIKLLVKPPVSKKDQQTT